MPITFTVHRHEGYYMAKYEGKLSDDMLLDAYRDFFQSKKWIPGLNELADLSEVDAGDITRDGLTFSRPYWIYV